MRVPRPLLIAGAGAVASTVALALVRVGALLGGQAATPQATLPVLVALALLCVVGLTATRRPVVAWIAIIADLSIATLDLASLARSIRPTLDGSSWLWLSVAICATAVFAAGTAIWYATDRHPPQGRWVPALGLAAMAVMLVASVWALATLGEHDEPGIDASPLGSLTLVTRPFLATTLGFTALGLIADARPAARRASRRLAVERPRPSSLADRIAYLSSWVRTFADESSPGRTRAYRAALQERSRIASDLHAEVVPAVRRALAEAEQGGSVDRLAASLRDVLADVDDMVQREHAIQLELGGIVPALEWLAERIEERSDVRVAIDVVADGPGRPPSEIEAAAFRVAGLALENVARHAPGSSATVAVAAVPDRVHMEITDDGPGIRNEGTGVGARRGGRGLRDMAAESAACGASLVVARHRNGTGTCVTFRWPAD